MLSVKDQAWSAAFAICCALQTLWSEAGLGWGWGEGKGKGVARVRVSNNCKQRRGKASLMRHLKWAGKRVKCNGSQFVASCYKGDVLRLRIQFSWHSWQSKESEGWRGDELVSVRSKMNQLLIAEYLADCGCICARLKIKKWQKKKRKEISRQSLA